MENAFAGFQHRQTPPGGRSRLGLIAQIQAQQMTHPVIQSGTPDALTLQRCGGVRQILEFMQHHADQHATALTQVGRKDIAIGHQGNQWRADYRQRHRQPVL